MKKLLPLLVLLLFAAGVQAQEDSLSSFTLSLGQDSYFGFYVTGSGSYSLSKQASITFYTNYWANPAFGTASTGTDFWTELGGGVSFSLCGQRLVVNPSLGFTYGKALSGGERGVLGDGIVPSLTATLSRSRAEINAGIVWFKALRKEGPVTVDYVWAWFAPGRKINQRVTAGIHLEEFYLSRMTAERPKHLYQWVGPYLQYNFPKGTFIKAAGGYDTINKSFIKLNISTSLTQ
jgi:hypothetical protein